MKSRLRGLYAITPETPDTADLLNRVEAALRGGCRWLQYRDKTADATQRRSRAEALRAACLRHGAALIINDDIELALEIDASGAHLGRDDGDLTVARRRLGPGKILGVSCYAEIGRAEAAARSGADYVAFGAVYASTTKPEAVAAPHSLFKEARETLGVPTCAIGGITLDNASAIIHAGADLIAVITDLFTAPDISARAEAYQQLFEEISA